MDKEYLTKLTNDLYRLTLLFPKKEPLRYKMRELANNILANLILILEGDSRKDTVSEVKKDLEPLCSFFEVAKTQNWVNPETVSEIQEKYDIIKAEIAEFERGLEEDEPQESPALQSPALAVLASLNSRQAKIIEILKEREKIQVGEVQREFPRITKRTLRRDFDALLKQGLVARSGKANLTFYKLADKDA